MQTGWAWLGLALLSAALVVGCNASNGSQVADLEITSTSRSPDDTVDETLAAQDPRLAEDGGPTVDITFDDLKFQHKWGDPYDPALLTERILGLEGRNIRVRGYILPAFQSDGIRQFVLVRDNQECCFGPGAALFDCIRVQLKDGYSISYTTQPISVEGRLAIDPLEQDETTLAVFYITGQEVEQ